MLLFMVVSQDFRKIETLNNIRLVVDIIDYANSYEAPGALIYSYKISKKLSIVWSTWTFSLRSFFRLWVRLFYTVRVSYPPVP